jgi:hypothetical protein
MKYFIPLVFIGLLFYGCEKPPSYANMPIITSIAMTPTLVRSFLDDSPDAQALYDTVQIRIGFTDGNGAIGIPTGDTTNVIDAYVTDSRPTPSGQPSVNTYSIPYITPNGNVKAISGIISFTVNDIIGRIDAAHSASDTLYYTVTIVDRNGNVSNAVKTPYLYIKDN